MAYLIIGFTKEHFPLITAKLFFFSSVDCPAKSSWQLKVHS